MSISSNMRVPLFWAEVTYGGASLKSSDYPTLICGQILEGTANTPTRVSSPAEVAEAFGLGSQVERMARAYFANDTLGETYVLGVADAATGVQATGKLTITGTATAAGALYLRIGGQELDIPVSIGDTATDLGDLIEAALTTHASSPTSYPVSASNAAGVVTLTAKWDGETGNDILLETNPLQGQADPAGITVAVTNHMGDLVAGANNPDTLATAFAAVAALDLDHILVPWTDSTSITAYSTLMSDTNGRWGYTQAQYGQCWTARQGTQSELQAFGDTSPKPNDPHVIVIGIEGDIATPTPKSPNPPYEVLGGYAGQCAASLRDDPALPCQTLSLANDQSGQLYFHAPAIADRFSVSEQNSLLGAGIATVSYSGDGKVRVQREMTSYIEDASSNPAELDVQPLSLSAYLLRALKARIERDFSRSKVIATNDVTEKEVKGAIVALYSELEGLGYVEDVDGFSDSLSVSVSGNRIDVDSSPDYVNQLRVVGFTNNFKL